MSDDSYDEYRARMEEDLATYQTEPSVPGAAVDLVTRQPLLVDALVSDDLVEHAMDNDGFDLSTYKSHPSLPVSLDDTVYKCYFITGDPNDAWKLGEDDDYDFPRGRLQVIPAPWAGQYETGAESASDEVSGGAVLDDDEAAAVLREYAASESEAAVGDDRLEPSTEDDGGLGAFDPDAGIGGGSS